jgi:hypothetical protein
MVYSASDLHEVGLDDFKVFLTHTWNFLGLPDPTPVQLDIADYLQYGPRRLMVEAFRGVGKSWISGAFALWCFLQNIQIKIMVASANQNRADQFSIFCKQLINEMPLLAHMRPGPDEKRTSNIAFDIRGVTPSQSPSMKSVGITGQLTGSRADFIIADDIEVLKNSYTHTMRERISELVKEFGDVLKPHGRILYLGTPQVEDSLYNRLPARGYKIRVWPSEVPRHIERYKNRLAPKIMEMINDAVPVGTPSDPRRFGKPQLDERRAEHGKSGYALQYMLDTSPSDIERHPLKLHDLIITDLDRDMAHAKYMWSNDRPHCDEELAAGGFDGDYYFRPSWKSEEVQKYNGTVMAIDPSGAGTDETGYAIVRLLAGQLFLVDVGGYQSGHSLETLEALAEHAARHGAHQVVIEENFGGGTFGQLLRPILAKAFKEERIRRQAAGILDPDEPEGCDIEEVHHTGQKELRILDACEGVVQTHRVIVDRAVIERDLETQDRSPMYSFVYQFTRMTRDRGALAHEDRLEAFSMAVKHWADMLSTDVDKSLEQHKEDLLDAELERFKENCQHVGEPHVPKQLTWTPSRN